MAEELGQEEEAEGTFQNYGDSFKYGTLTWGIFANTLIWNSLQATLASIRPDILMKAALILTVFLTFMLELSSVQSKLE